MSVSWGTQYPKLKSNLRLASNRLKLLQKKKTEQAHKAQVEVTSFLNGDKEDRARIRVESIIREDFIVEAYELLEMYCELLLARFGLIQQMKELDDGIAEAVASLLWAAPRISHEVAEFKIITDQLTQKYGKQYCEAARMNQLPEPSRVSPKLIQKLAVTAPSKLLVEKYLIEIAKCAGIEFTPDQKIMREDDSEVAIAERNLINFINEESIGWNIGPQQNYNNPPYATNIHGKPPSESSAPSEYSYTPPPQYNLKPNEVSHQINYPIPPPVQHYVNEKRPYVDCQAPKEITRNTVTDFPIFPQPPKELPSVPGPGESTTNQNDLDFDALAKRFEELKKQM